jgi:hypothetical protein
LRPQRLSRLLTPARDQARIARSARLCFVFHCIAFDRSRRVASFRGNAGRVSLSGSEADMPRRARSAISVANDLGCVKTQKIEKCRELFFSDQVKAMLLRTAALSIAIQKKRSFCRGRAPLCFYTAKTHSRHAASSRGEGHFWRSWWRNALLTSRNRSLPALPCNRLRCAIPSVWGGR